MNLSSKQIQSFLQKEVDSITDNDEKFVLFCGDKSFYPGKKVTDTGKKYSIQLNADKINSRCEGKKRYLAHTHNFHPEIPSQTDYKTIKKIPYLDGYCIGGIRGMNCYEKDGTRSFSHNWNDDLVMSLPTNVKTFEGDILYCDNVHNKYYCEIENEINNKKIKKDIGVFNEIVNTGGLVHLNKNDTDFLLHKSDENKKIKCHVSDIYEKLVCVEK